MVQAALSGLSAITGAFRNQPGRNTERPQLASALPAIAAAPDTKRAKQIERAADKERLYNLLSQPEVLGFALTFAGITAAQLIPFSTNRVANEAIQATATSAAVIMGMGYAGVGDLTTLTVAALAGAGSLTDLFSDFGNNIGDAITAPFTTALDAVVKLPTNIMHSIFGFVE